MGVRAMSAPLSEATQELLDRAQRAISTARDLREQKVAQVADCQREFASIELNLAKMFRRNPNK
jgi:hypothetical protein